MSEVEIYKKALRLACRMLEDNSGLLKQCHCPDDICKECHIGGRCLYDEDYLITYFKKKAENYESRVE